MRKNAADVLITHAEFRSEFPLRPTLIMKLENAPNVHLGELGLIMVLTTDMGHAIWM